MSDPKFPKYHETNPNIKTVISKLIEERKVAEENMVDAVEERDSEKFEKAADEF